ncbi:DUF6683 family protein [Roseomonas sp. CECT 9278]|uniref:DUF6683 family protein n=1 Tax=Roseomonas sp. CECT 9278 TaxID=2845823 RepID=UPI001E5D4838|nr:DUF6683 family protein [Roseomonas sp. CECT 9278]CAH0223425.1 hypothetical protein ROS9278_02466 [Roseomonas sp. CECT 9278]
MHRLSLRHLLALALAIAPGMAHAQKAGPESRAAVMPFGTIGNDGQAAIGAGLRLFPTQGAAPVVAPLPTPAPAAVPAPFVKPGAAMAGAPVSGGLGKPAALPPTGVVATPARGATAFTTHPSVSARVRQQVLAGALPTSPNPQRLRQAVESGAPWQEFDRLLAQHGYDNRDLSDVVAAFYLIAWEVATGGDATRQPAGIAAVRGQARQMLAGMPNVAAMGDAERQATAETLAFHAMAMMARHHDLQAAGGVTALTAYRTEVAQAVAQHQGIDVRRFALTPAGFQPR